jgi:uncharacterized membrane protein
MPALIAIAFPDERTAIDAEEEAQRLAMIQPDAIAAIVRDKKGRFKVTTNHHEVAGGASWGMFWGLLFGMLFFVPFFGMAIGAGLGALFGRLEKSGIDKAFQQQVRDKLSPGSSALFLVVENESPVPDLSGFGGTVITSSLSEEAEHDLQAALHGEREPAHV